MLNDTKKLPQQKEYNPLQAELKTIRDRIGEEWKNKTQVNSDLRPEEFQFPISDDSLAKIVDFLPNKNYDILSPDPEGYTILLGISSLFEMNVLEQSVLEKAIECYHTKIGITGYKPTSEFREDLQSAIACDDFYAVEKLLNKASEGEIKALNYIYPLNGKEKRGRSLLGSVITSLNRSQGDIKKHTIKLGILKLLLDKEANPNIPCLKEEGRTLLHNAMRAANFEATRVLIEGGADLKIRGCLYRVPPLMYLLMGYKERPEECFKIAVFALKNGASPFFETGPGPHCNNGTHSALRWATGGEYPKLQALIEAFKQNPETNAFDHYLDEQPPSYEEAVGTVRGFKR